MEEFEYRELLSSNALQRIQHAFPGNIIEHRYAVQRAAWDYIRGQGRETPLTGRGTKDQLKVL